MIRSKSMKLIRVFDLQFKAVKAKIDKTNTWTSKTRKNLDELTKEDKLKNKTF